MINEVGNRYGKLQVISRGDNLVYGENKQKTRWNCLCECGNVKLIVGTQLRQGLHKSCGCGRGYQSYKGYEDISSTYFTSLKYGAKKRNISFDIKIQDIWDLYIKQNRKCALTGIPIIVNRHLSINRFKDQTASLDRIDSNKGYIIDNVWWVHKEINNLKSDIDIYKFIEICVNVAKHKETIYEQLASRSLSDQRNTTT